ncbi:efflux RND transporter periplasmic adaptor subunit [Parathalassolituus penaei]|uniref:Efflux RND transporter periplasmic adaptor subunit n=1 Tax=Parathalassolituus penaei TaxID=2997323 RepID=A0A9X3ITE0_9GAMM|nr:efflux RND transporter periplasmic adaptor subunit [Parathalassolituus penaei]MCY0966215.1 efflux RND transporter periplasmic adaptor subunit [Parathalassolituus penaei]
MANHPDSRKSSNPAATNVMQELGLNQPRQSRWIWLVLVVLLLIAAALWWWLAGSKSSTRTEYKTDAASRSNLVVTVAANGNIEPRDQVEVSSELSGIVDEVLVDFNDKVSKGQLLARLNTRTLQAEVVTRQNNLVSARASVEQSAASLEEAQLTFNDYQTVYKLSNGTHPSRQTYDSARIAVTKAKADLASAKASVAVAEAELESARYDLSKASIVSPIDGVVLARDIEPGQTVASSLSAPTLFIIARDLRDMELHVDIDEADIGLIKQGQTASFSVDAWPDKTFSASIEQIRLASTEESDSSVVSYETVLAVKNDDLLLLPQMTAITDITVQQADNALTIATAALRFEPDMAMLEANRPPRPDGAPENSDGGPQGQPPADMNGNKSAGNSAGKDSNSESGGLLSSLTGGNRGMRMGPPPGAGGPGGGGSGKGDNKGSGDSGSGGSGMAGSLTGGHAMIWVLRDNQDGKGAQPRPVPIETGISDGLRTEVKSGELQEGDRVITDAVEVSQ